MAMLDPNNLGPSEFGGPAGMLNAPPMDPSWQALMAKVQGAPANYSGAPYADMGAAPAPAAADQPWVKPGSIADRIIKSLGQGDAAAAAGAPAATAAAPGPAAAAPLASGAAPPLAPPRMIPTAPVDRMAGIPDAALPAGSTPATNIPTPAPVAAPVSADAGKPVVPPSSALGRIGDAINAHPMTLMALGAGLAGAQSWGQGISRGLSGAAAAMPADIKQGGINQTYTALRNRGIPDDIAKAAAQNPEILAQILPQAFGAKQRQFTQIGEDMLGNKKFGFVDPIAGKVYGLDGQEATPGSGAAGSTIPNGPDGMPLRGPDLLAHLERTDPVTASGVKGLIAGNLSAQGRNLQKLGPLAELVEPTFSMATFPQRMALQKSYLGGGKDFQETQALNTVGGHLSRLVDAADGLDNSSFKPLNTIRNFWADNFTGSPALVKFRNDLVTTQNELAKAYHGGHVSDSAFAAFNKSINEAQTPAEMKAAIGELGGLLQSKIEAKESGYRTGMGTAPLPAEYKAINEEAGRSFGKIKSWVAGEKPGAPQAAAAPQQPVRVSSPEEARRLPKGTAIILPDGSPGVVP
jgi:hypothetical protein